MASLTNISPSSPFLAFRKLTPNKPLLGLKKKPYSATCVHSTSDKIPPATLPPEVDKFLEWLCKQGVVSADCPVRPARVTEGLGLVAQRDIAEKEVILEIPRTLWISPDAVAASEIGNLCSELKPLMAVSLFLARENKREYSPWRIYLDILPKYTDSTVFWSEEELSELQGTQLLRTTIDVKEYVKNEFIKLEKEIIIPHRDLFPNTITLDDFFWAFGMVRSRAFSRLGQNLVVIPLADLINHNSKVTTDEYAEIKGTGPFSRNLIFSLWAPFAVKAGEQVYIQYDLNKSNAKLALDYGFTESNTGRNSYTLTFNIPESDPFFEDKLDIAETIGLSETAEFEIVLDRPLPPTMFPYLRLLALQGETDTFLLHFSFRSTILGYLDSPISRTNEELICQMVRDVVKSALSGYHTTVEEDEKLLEGENLDLRLRMAVEVRTGEKKVLQQIDEIFNKRALELDELQYFASMIA